MKMVIIIAEAGYHGFIFVSFNATSALIFL